MNEHHGALDDPQAEQARVVAELETALKSAPDSADLHSALGNALKRQGRLREALTHHRQAVALSPNEPAVRSNYAAALLAGGDLNGAIEAFRAAVLLMPEHGELCFNLATALQHADRLAEAAAVYRRALALLPDHARAQTNLGCTLKGLGQVEEAIVHLRRAVSLEPCNADAQWNLALALLLAGRFEEGWQVYEWRRQIPEIPICRFALPEWDGQAHSGKVLLLHAEQGLGDSLQFIRFASLARARVGRLVFMCHPPLLRLFASVPGIDALVPLGQQPPPCDMHLPLLSLPRVLGVASSAFGGCAPYLAPDPALVKAFAVRLASIPRPRIGICWQGNPSYRDDGKRSIPVRHFLPLLEAGVHLVSVQKNHGLEQLAAADPEGRVRSLGPELDLGRGAFVDTAAVLANLDLLITSDTAMPHLGGALGVPVWCLLPHVPDWRWGLSGDRTPWYPTMRLFRQTRPGDWDSVFTSVRTALASLQVSAQGAAP